jgi:uncharacterized protein YdhG (YjbR/CyaY superfamily)
MQYDAKTPQEYLELLDPDWRREKLLELRELIMAEGPELIEGISYGMLIYSDARGGLFALNAQKHYVSFYVGDAKKIDPDGSLLQGLNRGKGCIRFSKSVAVTNTRIEEFIRRAVKMHRLGEDVAC